MEEEEEDQSLLPATRRQVFLTLLFLYMILSGSIVRVFQSMATTFALCGPLLLHPNQ